MRPPAPHCAAMALRAAPGLTMSAHAWYTLARMSPNTPRRPRRPRRVSMSLRIPAEHAGAIRRYATTLGAAGHLVTASSAGAAVLAAGLRALRLLPPAEGATS